ncbi:ParA family protein [Ruminococcus sp. RTP21484sp1_RTP31003st1_F6_RTP31003_210430]|uniref:ParA family protein n=1 Tax=Ruminococcus sp. RTP21484sp1_RTP31003st1_F6_RTP31003_210430 TaxID=3141610 RepID=UPI0034A20504
MCKIIAIANQKGGVAKTTTTINLGVGLSKVGKRVMLIDADPQGHLTMGLGFPKNLRVTLKTMMENIIMGLEFDPREAILHHEEGIDVIPSNKLLSGMDMSLFTVEDREKVLKEYLELLENDYDYILIDCMPSLGMMTINALSAADSVLIPVQPQYYAADGLMELLKVVKGIVSGASSVTGSMATKLKQYSDEGNLTELAVQLILNEKKTETGKVTLTEKKIRKYFPKEYNREQIEQVIYELLDNWKKSQ